MTTPVAEAKRTISWALETHPDLLMTSGFNLSGVVLLDLAVEAGYRGKVVFVDTLEHFPETLAVRDAVALRYPDTELVTLAPQGAGLPTCGSADCCAVRKVAPLRAYLDAHKPNALLSARSRFQSETRALLNTVEDSGSYVKVNPLVHWTREELERYARRFNLPVNPLYWQGYLSIGCAPTTRRVEPGEGVRAGRWDGSEKTECGLWMGEGAL